MRRINKKRITLCAFLAAASCVALGFSNVNEIGSASANGEVTLSQTEFAMENGASVRVAKTGGSGIRFGFSIAKSAWTKLQTAYPSDTYTYKVYTEIDKTGNTDEGEEQVVVQDEITFGENETEKLFWASIVYDDLDAEIEDYAFALSLTANTYIDIVQTSNSSVVKTFEASNNGQSRSIREVAWLLLEQGLFNGDVVENYRGEVEAESASQDFDAWGETFSAKVNGDVYGVYLNDYNTKIDTYSVSDGTLSFDWASVAKSFKAQNVIVMTSTGIATYPCNPIYNMTQANAYKLRELSMDKVDNERCRVFVTENIDMSQVTWTVDFEQNLQKNYLVDIEGNGKTISKLGTTSYTNNPNAGIGLFHTFTGSIKNLSFVECASTHSASGLIAGVLRTSTFENVYIEVDSIKTGSYSGAISWQSEGGQTVALNNVYVSMPTNTAAAAFVTGFGKATYNMTDCVFVGGNGKAVNNRDGYAHTLNGTPIHCEDIAAAYDNFYGKTDVVSKAFMANAGSTIIAISNTPEDITKLLTATDGYLMLVEDINLAGRTDVLVANFYGTLNGNGHTIKNVPVRKGPGDYYGGIFGYLNGGTVKNVALEIPNMVANFGGIAYGIHNYAVIDNVYIKVNGYTNSSATGTMTDNYQAAIGRNVYLHQVTITNTVIDMATENVNNGAAFVVGFYQTGTLDLAGKNCHFIGGNGYMMSNTGANVTNDRFGYVKNYTTYTDRAEFDAKYNAADSTIKLSDEMKAWLGLN